MGDDHPEKVNEQQTSFDHNDLDSIRLSRWLLCFCRSVCISLLLCGRARKQPQSSTAWSHCKCGTRFKWCTWKMVAVHAHFTACKSHVSFMCVVPKMIQMCSSFLLACHEMKSHLLTHCDDSCDGAYWRVTQPTAHIKNKIPHSNAMVFFLLFFFNAPFLLAKLHATQRTRSQKEALF